MKTNFYFALFVVICCCRFSFSEEHRNPYTGATYDSGNLAPNEAGMSPAQVDLKRRHEWNAWLNRKDAENLPGFFEDQPVDRGCTWYQANQAALKGQVIAIHLPTACEKAFRHQIKVTLNCGDGGGLSLAVPVRGKFIYWKVKDIKGKAISNDKGAIQLNFISVEDFQIESEIKLFTDPEMKQPLKIEKSISLSESDCRRS